MTAEHQGRVCRVPFPMLLDSTHITFGLVTVGVYDRRWKAEMSVFNGREPDSNRADLDLGALDSVCGRISLLANERLTVQASAAHLNEAEAGLVQQPRIDVNRATQCCRKHAGRDGGSMAPRYAGRVAPGVGVFVSLRPSRHVM